MAASDFTMLAGSIDHTLPTFRRLVTGAFDRPPGGGSFVLGMRTLSVLTGAHALATNQAGFTPTAAGKDQGVRCALQKKSGESCSAFVFACLQTSADVSNFAYLLGLSEGAEPYVTLAKRRIVDGIASSAPGALGVLRRSTEPVPLGAWQHLRLDVVLNLNDDASPSDVVLNVFRNDLTKNPVTAPVWAPVPGIDRFVDDIIGGNTGSPPLGPGRIGLGGRFANVGEAVLFDDFEALHET